MTYRLLNGLLVLIAAAASLFAIGYLQLRLGLDPCPLCIFQRIGLWSMAVFALLASLINPQGKILRALFWLGSVAGTLWGLGVALRHTWLHYSPSAVPSCGAGLGYWVDTLPMAEVISIVLAGNGDCSMIDWSFLGLSIPAWTAVLFLVILGIQFVILTKIIKKLP
ncbi:disulfide bond formation protein B [Moraxella nasicaprae]|uniref:Disulfide bond formation protein B n=1 Tax=Moraxella nasicaprae TaxID=2904122 RepID=A0ABY6F6M1_9GAMM|nr:disulfide bond formation protein B [Moraxella nasicaprae]UXZ05742.1 disulfide bond formation protein B [Moraxella nasicaprae]